MRRATRQQGGQQAETTSTATGAESSKAAADPSSRPWFSAPSVKVILAALCVFALVHVAMWFVVYGHIRDRFDDRLHASALLAWTKVKEVASHL
mmetsp:Transcript_45713/g.148604  ORF Transcript_45713/g.148604 Transcript_45713/m.148604 type:complete len:94 (-) Transcript_45713:172-453(-)